MKKIFIMLMVLSGVFSMHAKSIGGETVMIEQQENRFEGNSILYNLYDSTLNGFKGAGHAAVAVPCSFGLYIPYSYYKFLDLCCKKFCLLVSNASTFNNHTREELERETVLREFSNRGAKAFVSFLYMVIPIAIIASAGR